MMTCPHCKTELPVSSYNCPDCGYGLACQPKPTKRGPRFLGDTADESRDEELARTFRCSNCRSCGGNVKRISLEAAGATRLFGFPFEKFIVVSCAFCGVVQLYDPKIVDRGSSGWPFIDSFSGEG
jgi:predicted nucleic-acid-binding Zn-ribbon protein